MLFTDHKPLVGLVKTVNLDSVGNHRLLCMLDMVGKTPFFNTSPAGFGFFIGF